ncbi:unknown [Spodoptera litura nucleopolyhedrovirus]|uniref:Uncharacterized protein n=2 Tax=Spodoptera litura multicapsid nucleopolyhedrovirus TaxID=46242 RepID=Q91BI8_NPVST|nr:hypothetical protein [Spodoptera litura nucleopolyhedrovirus]AAL01717.1 unknown [Spodoptera litura nucleopolyhedrovirus]QHN73881.1 hypothetical protein [Spodoptera litura nucleopolyhedrovirus]
MRAHTHTQIHVCTEIRVKTMEYSSCDLLKNTPFSSKLELSFDRYMNIVYLSKGLVPTNVNDDAFAELGKLRFKIDPVTRYVRNILDYQFVVKDNDMTTVYVTNPETKALVGVLRINFENTNVMNVRVQDIDRVQLDALVDDAEYKVEME